MLSHSSARVQITGKKCEKNRRSLDAFSSSTISSAHLCHESLKNDQDVFWDSSKIGNIFFNHAALTYSDQHLNRSMAAKARILLITTSSESWASASIQSEVIGKLLCKFCWLKSWIKNITKYTRGEWWPHACWNIIHEKSTSILLFPSLDVDLTGDV